jgi:hypothetical protein
MNNNDVNIKMGVELDAKISDVQKQLDKIMKNMKANTTLAIDYTKSKSEIQKQTNDIAKYMQTEFNKIAKVLKLPELTDKDSLKYAKDYVNQYVKLQKLVSEQKKLSMADSLSKWITNNSKATKMFGTEINSMITKLRSGANITDTELKQLTTRIAEIKLQARDFNKLGFSGFDKIKNVWEKFGGWSLATSSMMAAVSKIKEAVTELKTVDTILTEITKTSNATEAQIKKLGEASFDAASKYGRKASDYLTSVQEMNRSGFQGKQGTDMAEQSIMAQSAGDMTEEIADKWILATNAAYEYEGEAKRINAVLDGANEINTMVSFAW